MTNQERFENIWFDGNRTIVEKRFNGLYQSGIVLTDENGVTVAAKILDAVTHEVVYKFN